MTAFEGDLTKFVAILAHRIGKATLQGFAGLVSAGEQVA